MLKKDILDNPIIIFILSFCISIINILFSVHFIPLMFVSILVIAFIKMLDNRYYYSLLWIIFAFLVVENIQGFKAFSMVAVALSLYIIVKPNIENIFSSPGILNNLYISIFYILILFLYSFSNQLDISLIVTLLINFIIDIIIIGLFI